jgi:hypothetical protein
MLQLTQGQTSETILVTLTELATIKEPYYLFVFTHVTTKMVVTLILNSQDDLSDYPQRFNEFTVNTATVFANGATGEWHYTVYEQDSAANANTTGLNALEYGKLRLNPSVQFNYTQYNTATIYKAYNG